MRVERNGIRFVDHECEDISVVVDDGYLTIEQSGNTVTVSVDDAAQLVKALADFLKKVTK